MHKINNLPNILSVFPLSNFIFFPNTSAPLNIFEPRYIQMIDESIKTNRMIGMLQPKGMSSSKKPELYFSALNDLGAEPIKFNDDKVLVN